MVKYEKYQELWNLYLYIYFNTWNWENVLADNTSIFSPENRFWQFLQIAWNV